MLLFLFFLRMCKFSYFPDEVFVNEYLWYEIEEVTEELGDENEFIRRENEIRAERISFEERNRLYNRIAAAVRTRTVRSYSLLEEALVHNDDKDGLRSRIIYASVLGAYIKRMGRVQRLRVPPALPSR